VADEIDLVGRREAGRIETVARREAGRIETVARREAGRIETVARRKAGRIETGLPAQVAPPEPVTYVTKARATGCVLSGVTTSP